MMRTQVLSWDPSIDEPVKRQFDELVPVDELVAEARRLWACHAHEDSSLEFAREDGSALSIATDGTRAFLVWMNSLHESFQSVGTSTTGPNLIFDFGGSFSEADASALVSLAEGIESIEAFLDTGAPDTPRVLFDPC